MSTTIAVDNSSVIHGLSKMNWVRSGSSYIFSSNPGAYLKIKFTGTSFATIFDMAAVNLTGTGGLTYPVIRYSIDSGAPTTFQLLSSTNSLTMATGLADTTHTLLLEFVGTDQSGNTDRWKQIMGIKITSFSVDDGKTVANADLLTGGLALCYGDSITEGAVALGPIVTSYAIIQDATVGYQALIASGRNMEYSNVAFAGQRLGGGTNVSQVPGLTGTFDQIQSGVNRIFEQNINFVTINMGTNGSVDPSDLSYVLTGIRSGVGTTAFINVIIPFGQFNKSNLGIGYSGYTLSNPSDTKISLIDLGSFGSTTVTNNSYDATHPNSTGHRLLYTGINPFISSSTYGIYAFKRFGSRLKFKVYQRIS